MRKTLSIFMRYVDNGFSKLSQISLVYWLMNLLNVRTGRPSGKIIALKGVNFAPLKRLELRLHEFFSLSMMYLVPPEDKIFEI